MALYRSRTWPGQRRLLKNRSFVLQLFVDARVLMAPCEMFMVDETKVPSMQLLWLGRSRHGIVSSIFLFYLSQLALLQRTWGRLHSPTCYGQPAEFLSVAHARYRRYSELLCPPPPPPAPFPPTNSGVSTFCGSDKDSKVRALFDIHGNEEGSISEEDTKNFFTAVFKVRVRLASSHLTPIQPRCVELVMPRFYA